MGSEKDPDHDRNPRMSEDDRREDGDDILEPLLIITPEVVDGSVEDEVVDDGVDEGEDEEMMEEWL